MKTLKDFLEVYEPKAPDEKKFKDKHVTIKFKDRNEVGGKENGDDVFNASNVKTVARKDNRQGYNVGEDEKVYEEADIESMDESELLEFALNLIEKTLTPAEKKKREEIAKAIERDNPDMPMAQKMAIATAQAKKVAEDVEDLDELSVNAMKTYRKAARADAYDADDVDDERRYRKRAAGSNTAGKKIVRKGGSLGEQAELDELSNTTLGSYVKKATNQAFNKGFAGGANLSRGQEHEKEGERQVNKAVKRVIGVNKAVNKMTKEEVEDLDETAKIVAHLQKRYGDNIRKSHVRSAANDFGVGYTGLAHAVRKKLGVVRLEEDEQVDEISTKLALDYMDKASDASGHKNLSTPKLDKRYKSVALAHKKIGGRGVTVQTNEEADQIDELSKKTLGSYVKKAKDQMSRSDQIAGIELGKRSDLGARVGNVERKHNKRASKRYFGIDKAVDKLTKEEAEQIDELSKKTLGSYVKKASGAERPKNVMSPKSVPITTVAAYQGDSETGHFGKRFNQATYDKAERLRKNRETGINRAVDKLTKEEAEGLEEISKDTMGRYINRAKDSIDMASYRQGAKGSTSGPLEKKLTKRHKGIETAVKKLTKEDIINRAVSKYVPEELKFTPEERMIKRLEGLTEDHIDVLMGLFESLNDVNQAKMIESAETEEGRNQLLDFAINNRGA